MKLLISNQHTPAYHLALEEYLFKKSTDDLVLFYVNAPCVVIGCNQVLENEVNEGFCIEHEIPVYRRMSGGGAVYHDYGNLNYSFIRNKGNKKTEISTDFLKPILIALTHVGLQPVIGKRNDIWLPDGNKISGTAAHITASRSLYHGTLLYQTNLDHLAGSLAATKNRSDRKGIASVPSPVKNIADYLNEYHIPVSAPDDFFSTLIQQVKIVMQVKKHFLLDENNEIEIKSLMDTKYLTDEWNRKK